MIKDDLPDRLEYSASLDEVKALVNRTLLKTDKNVMEVMQHLTQKGGKNLRSMLMLICSSDENGYVPKNAVTCAAALEILHLASLVHDDIIDDSRFRRGQLSVQSRFGKKTAVICGDYLFCKCFSMVSEILLNYPEKFKDFSRAMTKICLGELRQFKHNANLSLSVVGYLRIIAGKTSALFSLAMYSGTIISGKSEKDARFMARLGYHIGMFFQILDDCMDYEADYKTAKKSIRHDLAQGVVTLPLIYAFLKIRSLRSRFRDSD